MKKSILLLITSATLMSCVSGPNGQTGAVIGALGGAALGGIIGNQSGRGLEGAAIGAGAGALGGAAIGNARDQQNASYQNSGYYDRNGNWVPAQQQYQQPQRQQQQQGYYDRNGTYRYY